MGIDISVNPHFSQCNFDFGHLMIRTERPYYYPGNLINGTVYMRITQELMARELQIRVTGKERSAFTLSEYVEEGEDRTGGYHEDRCYESMRYVIDNVFTGHHFYGPLMPGDYAIPFNFVMPGDVPASIIWEDQMNHAKPEAELTYKIRACIINVDGSIMM